MASGMSAAAAAGHLMMPAAAAGGQSYQYAAAALGTSPLLTQDSSPAIGFQVCQTQTVLYCFLLLLDVSK